MPVRGKVRWFSGEKGYGFIELDERGDVFAHYTDILSDEKRFRLLRAGSEVEFDLEEGKNGLRARNIVVLRVPGKGEASATD